jgi:hypothetical protein
MNRGRSACLVLVCMLALSCTGGSDDREGAPAGEARPSVELTSTVDRAEAGVSDPVTFRVTLDAAPGVSVSLPELGDMIQGFRILDMGTEGPKQKEGRMWSREWFKLRADRTGSYLLPAVRAAYTEPDGTEGSAEAPQIFVEIKSTLDPEAGDKDIRDIKPLEKVLREFPLAWVLGGAGAVLLLAGVTAWLILRRKRREEAVGLLPANERARMELDDLEATGILDEGRYREYVFNISLIFRRFLERRYRIAAVEQTSEEIMAGLRKGRVLEEDLKQRTRSFLEETDPIKYSGLEPREEETETMRTQLLTFLDRSAPPEEPLSVMEQSRDR